MNEHMKFVHLLQSFLKAGIRFERPVRDTVISEDEILNLRISLETSKDVNDFLAKI